MNSIELTLGHTIATILLEGAWLADLSDKGEDILYPKQLLTAPDGSQKSRGGCHVCLPNFGPGGSSGLLQHGFGRISSWTVRSQTEASVSLSLTGIDNYQDLQAILTYQLQNHAVTMALQVENTGSNPLRVAPGFHPYFQLQSDETEVAVSDEKQILGHIGGTVYREGEGKQLLTARRTLDLTSTNLPLWAIWTDQLGPYVCVEPTNAGNTFLHKTASGQELLGSGEKRDYALTIRWEP